MLKWIHQFTQSATVWSNAVILKVNLPWCAGGARCSQQMPTDWSISDISGVELGSLTAACETQTLSKVSSILNTFSHSLNDIPVQHNSSRRNGLIPPKRTTWGPSFRWPSVCLTLPSECHNLRVNRLTLSAPHCWIIVCSLMQYYCKFWQLLLYVVIIIMVSESSILKCWSRTL